MREKSIQKTFTLYPSIVKQLEELSKESKLSMSSKICELINIEYNKLKGGDNMAEKKEISIIADTAEGTGTARTIVWSEIEYQELKKFWEKEMGYKNVRKEKDS